MPRDIASVLDVPLQFAREAATRAATEPTQRRRESVEMLLRGGADGWVKVDTLHSAPQPWPKPFLTEHDKRWRKLPHLLKVKHVKSVENRNGRFEIVQVLEHSNDLFNKTVAVLWNDQEIPLQPVRPRFPGAVLTINIRSQELRYDHDGEQHTLDAFTDIKKGDKPPVNGPLPKSPAGRPWKIEIPDFMHFGDYGPMSSVWFKLITDSTDLRFDNKKPVTDRYLHAGSVSWGCATVGRDKTRTDRLTNQEIGARWRPLCEYLLNCRLDGGNSHVGVLHVVDTPSGG